MLRPRRPRLLPVRYDPVRRFVAAYTLQGVMDYLYPPEGLEPEFMRSAADFVHSSEGQALIATFGIPLHKIQERLGEAVG